MLFMILVCSAVTLSHEDKRCKCVTAYNTNLQSICLVSRISFVCEKTFQRIENIALVSKIYHNNFSTLYIIFVTCKKLVNKQHSTIPNIQCCPLPSFCKWLLFCCQVSEFVRNIARQTCSTNTE